MTSLPRSHRHCSEPIPKRRYLVVATEDEARRTLQKQVVTLVQLNEGHSYTYDRDMLIRMLDEALAQSRSRLRRERQRASTTMQVFND